ncbi:MAG: arginine--tRNA ligase [Clostridium sp.]
MGMAAADKLGLEAPAKPETVMVDYGGANVAKPLHVGHLRAAIIGESITYGPFLGHNNRGRASGGLGPSDGSRSLRS